jgi:hypothetical protein
MKPSDFPLAWPSSLPRTSTRVAGKFKVSFQAAYDALVTEAEKLHDEKRWDVIISTNIPLDKKGMPVVAISSKSIGDPGVAVYLWKDGKPYCIVSDIYLDVRSNMREVALTIAHRRTGTRRRASALSEQSTVGFCHEIETEEPAKVKKLAAGR